MREDYESTDLEGAARFERERAIAAGEDDRPTRADLEDDAGPDACWDCGCRISEDDDVCPYCGADL